jgi:hypothetical protein
MVSQATSIAFNNSEITYFKDHQIDFQILDVFLPNIPVVKIKTKTEYMYLHVNLERQNTYYIVRYPVREAFSPSDTPQSMNETQ